MVTPVLPPYVSSSSKPAAHKYDYNVCLALQFCPIEL